MDIKDVENLANLARIDLEEREKQEILENMQGILSYVKVIESVPTQDIDVQYDIHNVWREDVVGDGDFSRDLILDQFPSKKDNFLKVKKIL